MSAPLDRELRDPLDLVVLAVGEVAGRPGLPVGRCDHERHDQAEPGEREPRDLPVHARPLRLRVRAVRDEQEQRQQDEVRDDARAPVGDEGQRDPGQGNHPQDAADDDERLEREAERQSRGEQLREAVVGHQRHPHPARDEEHEDEQQAGGADEAELLRDRRSR